MNQTTNQPNKYTQLKYKKEPLFLKLPSGNRYEEKKKSVDSLSRKQFIVRVKLSTANATSEPEEMSAVNWR